MFVDEIFENLFYQTFEGEGTSLGNKQKNKSLMFIFNHKISIWNLKLTAKTMENRNFKNIFLKTMILHLQAY